MTGGGGLSRWLKWFRVEAPPPVPPSAVGARRVVVVDDVFCGFCPGPSCSFSAPSRPPGPLARRPPHSRSPPAFLLPASPPGPRASLPARPPGGGAWLCGALHAAHGLRSQGQWVVSALFLKTGWKHHGRKPSAAPRPPPRAPSEGFRGWEAQSLLGGPPAHLQAAPELRAQGGGRPADSGSGTRGP